ncbi:MAG: O-acetyl-ADP-ribose deacetylase [Ginsengibacter sp.]
MNNRIEIIRGDITKVSVDAIVNAANASLMGGGGVDGAIHKAGGKTILEECKKIVHRRGECKTGQAIITGAGNLPAKFVIHTVGPVWHGGRNEEEKLLADCYTNSLKLATKNKCISIAFPNISTGVYGFPKDKAALISYNAVFEYLKNNDTIERVLFVCFDEENYVLLQQQIITIK